MLFSTKRKIYKIDDTISLSSRRSVSPTNWTPGTGYDTLYIACSVSKYTAQDSAATYLVCMIALQARNRKANVKLIKRWTLPCVGEAIAFGEVAVVCTRLWRRQTPWQLSSEEIFITVEFSTTNECSWGPYFRDSVICVVSPALVYVVVSSNHPGKWLRFPELVVVHCISSHVLI